MVPISLSPNSTKKAKDKNNGSGSSTLTKSKAKTSRKAAEKKDSPEVYFFTSHAVWVK